MAISQESLLNFFESELALDISDIDASTMLFSSGLIDSFSLVSLIGFIEKEAGFKMNPIDVNLEHLDSIERILAYVDKISTAGVE